MDNTTISPEEVRASLRTAFAMVPCPETFKKLQGCGAVSHQVCLELRRDFYNYEPQELQYLLSSVLEDAMNDPSNDLWSEDVERLILQLDPLRFEDDLVRNNILEQFSIFTKEQASAICQWLKLARTWPTLSSFTDWVDRASNYWCNRLEKV